MSEKDVKDNETEALNNAAAENAENADIEAGETDMATSIESVDFAVVYDDGGDSIATESAENAENTEGIATEDSVASDNANRVNETLALGATDDEQSLDQHETVQADSATSVSSQIDREIKHHRKKDAFFFKANPTFALDHVTVHNRKTGRDVLDDVSLAFHAGATHAVLVDAEDVEQHQALVATMVGMMRTTSGNVMHKSTNLADATPVDVLGHRIGFIPQRFAVRGDLDAERAVRHGRVEPQFPAAQAGDCARAAQARGIRGSDFRSAGGQDECVGPASCGNRACAELRGGGDYCRRADRWIEP